MPCGTPATPGTRHESSSPSHIYYPGRIYWFTSPSHPLSVCLCVRSRSEPCGTTPIKSDGRTTRPTACTSSTDPRPASSGTERFSTGQTAWWLGRILRLEATTRGCSSWIFFHLFVLVVGKNKNVATTIATMLIFFICTIICSHCLCCWVFFSRSSQHSLPAKITVKTKWI